MAYILKQIFFLKITIFIKISLLQITAYKLSNLCLLNEINLRSLQTLMYLNFNCIVEKMKRTI